MEAVNDKHPYMELAAKLLDEIRFAKRAMQRPEDVVVMPVSFNSADQETNPIVTADGKTLFFSSDRASLQRIQPWPLGPEHAASLQRHLCLPVAGRQHVGRASIQDGVNHHAYAVNVDAFGTKMILTDDDGWTSELKALELGASYLQNVSFVTCTSPTSVNGLFPGWQPLGG